MISSHSGNLLSALLGQTLVIVISQLLVVEVIGADIILSLIALSERVRVILLP